MFVYNSKYGENMEVIKV